VDPLALRDLSPLGRALADPDTLKVLHAADNDLAYLKRLYGFSVAHLFDTAVAARFLGIPTLGLDGLLERYLGVAPAPELESAEELARERIEAKGFTAVHVLNSDPEILATVIAWDHASPMVPR
jgi:DNA polymerase I-like protein with 3'-5' exonuclease and polymerase domains